MSGRITGIRSGSIAAEVGIAAGSTLLSINGEPINDILDYQFYAQDDNLVVEIDRSDQGVWLLEIEKDYDEELGIEFDDLVFDRIKTCQNRCVFCFVDQLPADVRQTLYLKDDDYRHSFINGNFITLTNLKETDWQKIETMHLSPLYVSVHCIQPEMRQRMLNHPRAGSIKQDLNRLCDNGIEVHTQIVLCPGWNDGPILEETIEVLASMYPGVASIGIVPVGLTRYREPLPILQPVSRELAVATIETVDRFQAKFRSQMGIGLVYLADEFYLKAGQDIPFAHYYDDFCQIENGIGISRLFLDEFYEIEPSLPAVVADHQAYIVSAESAQHILRPIVERLNRIKGLSIELIVVSNLFFGGGVSVAGLLTGRDIISALRTNYLGCNVIIPDIVLRDGCDMLLDDIVIEDIKSASGANIIIAETSAAGLVESLLGKY